MFAFLRRPAEQKGTGPWEGVVFEDELPSHNPPKESLSPASREAVDWALAGDGYFGDHDVYGTSTRDVNDNTEEGWRRFQDEPTRYHADEAARRTPTFFDEHWEDHRAPVPVSHHSFYYDGYEPRQLAGYANPSVAMELQSRPYAPPYRGRFAFNSDTGRYERQPALAARNEQWA